jgi:hypothetical protein
MASSNPVDRKLPVKYAPELALDICTLVAEGKTLVEIAKTDGMPSRKTIYKWLSVYPKFFAAYERARELSGQSLEDEALILARMLAVQNDFTGTKVQAINYSMQQLRWSAAHRDPARYGTKQSTTAVIPVQINTTLNLGQEGQPPAADISQSTYTIEFEVKTNGNPEEQPATNDQPPDEPYTIDLEPAVPDTDDEVRAFGLPETEEQDLHKPKRGRPVGRKQGPRKSPAQAKASATRYAKKQQQDKE